jgi:hypothetical protein
MALGRALVAAPAIALMVAAGTYAVQRGVADDLAFDASVEMGTWISSRSQPGEATWNWVRADLERAAAMISDPVSQELLGVLLLMRHERPDLTSAAGDRFRSALVARPTSGYTWANLAEVLYQQGETGPPFEVALRRAAEFGPSEPEVQRTVANLGLAVFDEVGGETRSAVDRLVGAGLRRNPPEMLQISGRRGRLDVACRHAQGIQSGAHQTWLHLCQSREATS